VQTLLAQIGDSGDGSAPANDNEGPAPLSPEAEPLDAGEIMEKIKELTDAAIGGLNDKRDFMQEKLEFFAQESVIEVKRLVNDCIDKSAA